MLLHDYNILEIWQINNGELENRSEALIACSIQKLTNNLKSFLSILNQQNQKFIRESKQETTVLDLQFH